MCTLTWAIKAKEYAVFFNRDEKKWRQTAIPPQIDLEHQYIMPIDPDGQGTWIGVNQMGYSFCLLNNYQAAAIHNSKPQSGGEFQTRGKLIPELIGFNSLADIRHYLVKIRAEQFRPFLLAIFAPELIFSPKPEVLIYSWNGEMADFVELSQPIISTSLKFEQANQNRASLFQQLTAGKVGESMAHYEFHASHIPKAGPLSVCMHREDAGSVSFSHIAVAKQISFSYQQGPPCQGEASMELLLENQNSYF